jgi:enterochelin esterase-like enzyme
MPSYIEADPLLCNVTIGTISIHRIGPQGQEKGRIDMRTVAKIVLLIIVTCPAAWCQKQSRMEQHQQKEADKICARHTEWPKETCLVIAQKRIGIGMTPDMVREAFGSPQAINRDLSRDGETQQWVYVPGAYGPLIGKHEIIVFDGYVYFDHGKVSYIQKRN